MNISSAQPSYSITSSNSADTITIDLSSISTDTIVLNDSSGYTSYAGSTYTISTGAGTGGFIAQDLSSIDSSIFSWKNEEFVDCLPELTRIKEMCEEYPGLKIAYEKFVTTYRLVKDDYDTPKNQRPIP